MSARRPAPIEVAIDVDSEMKQLVESNPVDFDDKGWDHFYPGIALVKSISVRIAWSPAYFLRLAAVCSLDGKDFKEMVYTV